MARYGLPTIWTRSVANGRPFPPPAQPRVGSHSVYPVTRPGTAYLSSGIQEVPIAVTPLTPPRFAKTDRLATEGIHRGIFGSSNRRTPPGNCAFTPIEIVSN